MFKIGSNNCKFDTNAKRTVMACSHHGQINHPLLYCKQLPSTHKPDSCSKGDGKLSYFQNYQYFLFYWDIFFTLCPEK